MSSKALSQLIGLGGSVKDYFAGAKRPLHTATGKPNAKEIQPNYAYNEPRDKRVLGLADYYYREGSFEKIQFARKWMRNCLIFQGYHELEWSEINVAWDVVLDDSGDYAFPNNYYRSLILNGVALYMQNEPLIEPLPSNDDADAQGAANAARTALKIIKRDCKYDYLRVIEAIYLRLFGNSFRYSYFSKDPRYGYVTQPVWGQGSATLSPGSSLCPNCGPMEGQFSQCPGCQAPIANQSPAVVSQVPVQVGTTTYPKGQIVTEVVNPLEIYIRSSSYDLWHAPFLVRNRVVDRLALQAAYQDVKLAPSADEGGGEAYATGGDLGLIYLQSLADLPGDPTQYAAWYERATAAAKCLLIEAWLRPSAYFFDKDLAKEYPDGLYIAKTGDTLLEARNESLDDRWTHYVYCPVPGRIWGDGDDDLIPKQLMLDETDRLILRNQGYNSSPILVIDSQRIDKNEVVNDPSTIIEVKPAGRPVSEAFGTISSQALSSETWQWRAAHLQDLQYHARVAPSAIGQHEEGVNTFGGQESMAAKSAGSLLPNLMLWKAADEMWATQVLKLAAENWLDERTMAVEGIQKQWEFSKLKGSALNLDKIHIVTRVLPINPQEQQAITEAVAAGALNPQDPRVQQKLLELYHLPKELTSFTEDAKAQWKEIEKIKQTGQQIQPMMIRDNDAVHIDICRQWLNSDEADTRPDLVPVILQHAQLHVMNMAKQGQMMAAVQGAGATVAAATGGPPPDQGGGPQGAGGPKKPQGNGGQQGGHRGGQSPKNPVTRQQRATKGQAAKPHRPQPSEGNQYHRKPAF